MSYFRLKCQMSALLYLLNVYWVGIYCLTIKRGSTGFQLPRSIGMSVAFGSMIMYVCMYVCMHLMYLSDLSQKAQESRDLSVAAASSEGKYLCFVLFV